MEFSEFAVFKCDDNVRCLCVATSQARPASDGIGISPSSPCRVTSLADAAPTHGIQFSRRTTERIPYDRFGVAANWLIGRLQAAPGKTLRRIAVRRDWTFFARLP